jgi:OmpA-OmpF porin, OOP family
MRFRLLAVLLAILGAAMAAAPASAWRTGPFMVFFPFGGDSLDEPARAILDNLAREFAVAPEAHIVVQGHTDRAGTDRPNLALSCRRARRAHAYLLTRGVASARTTIRAYGEAQPLVETEDGAREPQNRRVEFRFGTAAEIAATRSEGHRC